jgi:hypothetical protein
MRLIRLPLLAATLAACAPSEDALGRGGAAPPDTAVHDTTPRDASIEEVQRRLEQAERDAAARNREALEAAGP